MHVQELSVSQACVNVVRDPVREQHFIDNFKFRDLMFSDIFSYFASSSPSATLLSSRINVWVQKLTKPNLIQFSSFEIIKQPPIPSKKQNK